MTCEELLAILNEYVDGEIDPSICKEFEDHLSQCDPCEVEVDSIRKTVRLFQRGEVFPIPEEFQRRLESELRRRFLAKYS